jgi:hypothetical protein
MKSPQEEWEEEAGFSAMFDKGRACSRQSLGQQLA